MNVEPPRPLSDDERAVLGRLLAEDFPGAESLRGQVAEARVVGRCDCGCPTVYLEVPDLIVDAPVRGPLAPVEGRIAGSEDEPPGEVLLFVRDGRLSSLEYVFYTSKPPSAWPRPDQMTVMSFDR